MIKKIKEKYRVVAESGRNMGTCKTIKEAKHRLQQIEFFKHLKKNKINKIPFATLLKK